MKTCPTCHSAVFEDMDLCYACLHRFKANPSSASEGLDESFLELDEETPSAVPALSSLASREPAHAGEVRQLCPGQTAFEASGSSVHEWVLRLEMRNDAHPQQVWSMELNPANLPLLATA